MNKVSSTRWVVVGCFFALSIPVPAETRPVAPPAPELVHFRADVHLQSVEHGVVLTVDHKGNGVVEEVFYLQVEGFTPNLYHLGDAEVEYWEDGLAVYLPGRRAVELAVIGKPARISYARREVHKVEGYGLIRHAGDFGGLTLGRVPWDYLPGRNGSTTATDVEPIHKDTGDSSGGGGGGCTTVKCSVSCGGSSCSASCASGQKASCTCNNGFATCECLKC